MDDDESTTGSYRYIADQDKRVRRGQGTVESGKDAVSAYQMPLEMQTLIGLGSQPGECARSLRARYGPGRQQDVYGRMYERLSEHVQ